MKTAVTIVLLVAFVVGSLADFNQQYNDFLEKYGKFYTAEEFVRRQEIFEENVKKIEEHNSQPSVSFLLGVNEYADMTHEEFLMRRNPTTYHAAEERYKVQPSIGVGAPTSLDWRTSTNPVVVEPVRNAGQCGSSSAFAIVDSIGADYAVSSKEDVVIFDPAYVTDCDGQGCSGSTSAVVWNFITKFGLNWYYTECPTGPGLGLCINGYNCTKAGNEMELQNAVAMHGPIPVMIDASRNSFQLYSSGVYYDAACSSTTLDHTVLIVGYGSTNGQDYWIARNSWGTSWGMKGDILLSRNKNNNCGVATNACYAKNVHTCVCSI